MSNNQNVLQSTKNSAIEVLVNEFVEKIDSSRFEDEYEVSFREIKDMTFRVTASCEDDAKQKIYDNDDDVEIESIDIIEMDLYEINKLSSSKDQLIKEFINDLSSLQ
jgi:hypothetical protein